MRLAITLLLLMLGLPAAAQPLRPATPPPIPKQTLSVPLPQPPGHQLSGFGPPGRLAVGSDGTILVASSSFEPSEGTTTARSARVEVMAYGADGRQKYRTLLPVQAGVGPRGFNAESLGVVAYPDGQAAVFLSSSNTRVALPQDERSVTSLYRLDATGRVARLAPVPAAAPIAGAFYRMLHYVPTPDAGLLVGGGFGPDPFNWWIGRFDAEGTRAWQAGPGPAYPEDVYGLAVLPDSTVSAIILEIGQASGLSQWTVARFAADGTPIARSAFAPLGTTFARLPTQWVSAIDVFQSNVAPGLVRLDDSGAVIGRAAWPYDQTRRLIADGDGVAAVVCAAAGPLCFVVRATVEGRIRWQSQPGSYSDIARAPDGQIVAVSWSADLLSASLVRFADP